MAFFFDRFKCFIYRIDFPGSFHSIPFNSKLYWISRLILDLRHRTQYNLRLFLRNTKTACESIQVAHIDRPTTIIKTFNTSSSFARSGFHAFKRCFQAIKSRSLSANACLEFIHGTYKRVELIYRYFFNINIRSFSKRLECDFRTFTHVLPCFCGRPISRRNRLFDTIGVIVQRLDT